MKVFFEIILRRARPSPFATGSCPASVAADPAGKFLYVAKYAADNVSVFSINPATGALAAVAGSPFGAGTFPFSVTTVRVTY